MHDGRISDNNEYVHGYNVVEISLDPGSAYLTPSGQHIQEGYGEIEAIFVFFHFLGNNTHKS